jgi:hypothetical protein
MAQGEGKVAETLERLDAIRLIDEEIALHGEGIRKHLACYDARSALPLFHLLQLPVGRRLAADPNPALLARDLLTPFYGEALAKRFMITMLRITRASVGLQLEGRQPCR